MNLLVIFRKCIFCFNRSGLGPEGLHFYQGDASRRLASSGFSIIGRPSLSENKIISEVGGGSGGDGKKRQMELKCKRGKQRGARMDMAGQHGLNHSMGD